MKNAFGSEGQGKLQLGKKKERKEDEKSCEAGHTAKTPKN
jgi:hypothetical protein